MTDPQLTELLDTMRRRHEEAIAKRDKHLSPLDKMTISRNAWRRYAQALEIGNEDEINAAMDDLNPTYDWP